MPRPRAPIPRVEKYTPDYSQPDWEIAEFMLECAASFVKPIMDKYNLVIGELKERSPLSLPLLQGLCLPASSDQWKEFQEGQPGTYCAVWIQLLLRSEDDDGEFYSVGTNVDNLIHELCHIVTNLEGAVDKYGSTGHGPDFQAMMGKMRRVLKNKRLMGHDRCQECKRQELPFCSGFSDDPSGASACRCCCDKIQDLHDEARKLEKENKLAEAAAKRLEANKWRCLAFN